MGHLNNDLGAAMLSVYMTYYLIKVVRLDPGLMGLCFLIGQIADGLATVGCGLVIDKFDTRFGKRMPWYVLGVIMVAPCFLAFFLYPSSINGYDLQTKPPVSETIRGLYYIGTFSVFNIGWAFSQIAHMSIVNSITYSN